MPSARTGEPCPSYAPQLPAVLHEPCPCTSWAPALDQGTGRLDASGSSFAHLWVYEFYGVELQPQGCEAGQLPHAGRHLVQLVERRVQHAEALGRGMSGEVGRGTSSGVCNESIQLSHR